MERKRAVPRRRKRDAVLRADVRRTIEQVWPDGVVDMTFDPDESYFWGVHARLRRAFQRIRGARLLYERAATEEPIWYEGSDPEEDPPDDIEHSRSYYLFFVCPKGQVFTFETEIEDFEDESGQKLTETGRQSDRRTTTPGHGWTGWSVSLSLLAPFAVISLNEMSRLDNGKILEPGIEMCIQTEDGRSMSPEEHFRKFADRRAFEILRKVRDRIRGILQEHGIVVLPEEEWRKPVSWLRGGDDVFVASGGEPIRVLDAFFFEGL